MPSTSKTENLQLSQFDKSDQPKILVDYNKDMQKIDTYCYKLLYRVQQLETQVKELKEILNNGINQ